MQKQEEGQTRVKASYEDQREQTSALSNPIAVPKRAESENIAKNVSEALVRISDGPRRKL
uniref:Small, acid-soluble spore protein, alpha/beta type n=1 Tax=Heterorhabditis bacteriophora TaxID=37862 RepID=A0A1I7XR75_HETBA